MRAWVVAGLALTVAHPARAAPMVVTWTTWLQAGAGTQTRVLDELQGGQRVDVQACEGGWCRVVADRALGYVAEAMLAPTVAEPLQPAPGAGCFPGTHFTPEGAIGLTICPAVRR